MATPPEWELDLYGKVSMCAQYESPQEVFRWLKAVDGLKVHRRDMSNPGSGFMMFDRKLVRAPVAILSGDIKRNDAPLCAKNAAKNELLGGD